MLKIPCMRDWSTRAAPPMMGVGSIGYMVRILLADDHNVVRKGLRLLLESHPGFRVIGDVADGRAAVEFAERERPDVLVIDIAMPFLNGIEAARQISLKDPTIAIVFLSM